MGKLESYDTSYSTGSTYGTGFSTGPTFPTGLTFPTGPTFPTSSFEFTTEIHNTPGFGPSVSSPGFGPQPGSLLPIKRERNTELEDFYQPPPMNNLISSPSTSLGPQPGTTFIPGSPYKGIGRYITNEESQPIHTFQTKPEPTKEERKPNETFTKLLLLISLLYKQGFISVEERGKLKDMTFERNEMLYSALEVFDIDQDLEEFGDTVRRICRYL